MTRIIAGSAGGRRLVAPAGPGTRPTTDRVREALFSAVVAWADGASTDPASALAGLAMADLFAGSGAVGLEAASRGAAPVLLVEARATAAVAASRNARQLGLEVTVRTGRVEGVLAAPPPQPFDLVFLDPPYELPTEHLSPMLAAVLERWLTPSALVVVERSARTAPPEWPEGLETWTRRYGETVVHFAAR